MTSSGSKGAESHNSAKSLFTLKKRSKDGSRAYLPDRSKYPDGQVRWQFLLVTPVKIHASKQVPTRNCKPKEPVVESNSLETTKPSERDVISHLFLKRGQSAEIPTVSVESLDFDLSDHERNFDESPGQQVKHFSVDLSQETPIAELGSNVFPLEKPPSKSASKKRFNMFRLRMQKKTDVQHMLV